MSEKEDIEFGFFDQDDSRMNDRSAHQHPDHCRVDTNDSTQPSNLLAGW